MNTSGTWRDYDFMMAGLVAALIAFGSTVVFSATYDSVHNRPGSTFAIQVLYVLVGVLVMLGFSLTDYRTLARYRWPLYGFGLTMIVVVRLLGHSALGAQRWIQVGPVEFQPSEFEKLVMIITLAFFFASRHGQLRQGRVYLEGVALVGVPMLLVLLQPDLGTALVFAALFFAMAWAGGAPKRYLAGTLAAGLAVLPLAWPFLPDYQRHRFLAFIDPVHQDKLKSGYNLLQAQIALGSGGFWGKGFLAGTQGHLGYLPARKTDFIFAVYGEEFGFVGATVLLALFLGLIWRLLRGAGLARDEFGTLLVVGVAAMIFFHVGVNVGMNLGVLPVVGIPLPFMSSGGSALITNLAAVGIAQSVLMRRRPMRF